MKKKINLICLDYEDSVHKLTKKNSLFDDIKEILEKSASITDRIQTLGNEDENETNFIASYDICKEGIFCLFIHMKKGGAHKIKIQLLEKSSFSINEIDEKENDDYIGYIKGYTYFYLSKANLVMKSSREIKENEVFNYITYLLKSKKESYSDRDSIFSFGFHISNSFDITNIKSFETGNDLSISKSNLLSSVSKDVSSKLKDLFLTEGLSDIDPTQVVSASIVFKINQPKLENKKEQNKMMQQVLNVFNSDNVKIRDKNNKIVDLGKSKTIKEVSITTNALNYPDKQELLTEMEVFLSEVINNEESIN